MKRIVLLVASISLAPWQTFQVGLAEEIIAPAKVDAIAAPLVERDYVYGMAVGLVSPKGTQIIGYGRISDKDATRPGPDTEFEIGSISKVFTGLLLARLAEQKVVSLNEPVQKLLGDSMQVPKYGEREITLVDLATHTSGLPRMPNNFTPKDPKNPYADYTVDQMKEFLGRHKLVREPGQQSAYSNLGMGLLGHALALKAGKSYEALLRDEICKPLDMNDTVITLDASRQARFAQGHDADGNVESHWDIPTLAGAGAIRSTATDMLKFAQASLGLVKTPLEGAIATTHAIHFKDRQGQRDVGLAWQIRSDGVLWHNGQTGGFHSYIGLDPKVRVGVVVLADTATGRIDDLGSRLLKLMATGDAEPLDLPKSSVVEPAALERLVGEYNLGGAKLKVSREDDRLYLDIAGQGKLRVYAESPTRFYLRAADVAITFELDDQGTAQKLVLRQAGQDVTATRAK